MLFRSHVDVFSMGIGIPKKLCAVLPPFNNVAAIPDEAAAIHLCPIPLTCASIPLSRYVFPHPPGAFMLKFLNLFSHLLYTLLSYRKQVFGQH